MASLYEKPRSPYWYLRYRDPTTGKMRNRSTGLRRINEDGSLNEDETRKAKQIRAQWEARELSVPKLQEGEAWGSWVPTYLHTLYSEVPLTLKRAEAAWFNLHAYLRLKDIRAARLLTRAHCLDYVAWRTSKAAVDEGLRPGKRNTALLELKFLSKIMREAVARGLAPFNVVLQLGLKRSPAKLKPEISEAEEATIVAGLEKEKDRKHNDAMRVSWFIAMLQVCRLTETCVPLADVNLTEQTITFRVKGGRNHTALLHPDLIPLFTRLKKEGRKFAYAMPNNFAKKWKQFFERHGLGHLSFHSTRVTGVTRLREAGIDLRTAMDYVGHNSVIVHRIYDRGRKEYQQPAAAALSRSSSGLLRSNQST